MLKVLLNNVVICHMLIVTCKKQWKFLQKPNNNNT